MAKQAQSEFVGATSLMEWMVRSHGVPLRKAKIVMEKAVKYSEAEGAKEVSFRSLKKALQERKIRHPDHPTSVIKIQQPDRILAQTRSIGTPSEKRVKEHLPPFEAGSTRRRSGVAVRERASKRQRHWFPGWRDLQELEDCLGRQREIQKEG